MAAKVTIGKSSVTTTKLGLGTNKVGGHNLFQHLVDEDGDAVVKTALDQGIQLLDTAYMYGLGRSEEIIGSVLKNYNRDQVVLATKAAQDPENDLKPNNNPDFLTKAVDDALKRLQTDYLDIFYIHFPDDQTPKDEAVAALAKLKQAGKIRAIGVSNFSLAQIKEANRDGQVDIVEDNYSLVHRGPEQDLFPYLREQDISFVPYFPLASGLLTGKYSDQDADKFGQFTSTKFKSMMAAVSVVRNLAEQHEATVAQVVLAWYLANPDVAVVIPGARKSAQVTSNVQALNIQLSDAEYAEIDQTFAAFK